MSTARRGPRLLFGVLLMTATSALYGACGKSSSDCSEGGLTIAFSPMYSAYESSHTYQVPAIVLGVNSSKVTWTASDTSVASIADDPVAGGIMITVHKAGTATITAHAGSLCGSSLLTVTSAAANDWETGNTVYNNGVRVDLPDAGSLAPDGGDIVAACTECHGETATGFFKDVAHTPEQTGGYSDNDFDGIIRKGLIPDGGYYDNSIVSQQVFGFFHKFAMTDPELKGLIVYLRSLTPTPQTGKTDFGGRRPPPRDGGPGPGFQPDGG